MLSVSDEPYSTSELAARSAPLNYVIINKVNQRSGRYQLGDVQELSEISDVLSSSDDRSEDVVLHRQRRRERETREELFDNTPKEYVSPSQPS